MFVSQDPHHVINQSHRLINKAQPNKTPKQINLRIPQNFEERFSNRNANLNFSPGLLPKAQYENLPQGIKKQAEKTNRLVSFFQFVHQKVQALVARIDHCVKQVFSWMKRLFHGSKPSRPQPIQVRRNIPYQHMQEPNGPPIVVVSKEELNRALNKMKAEAKDRPKQDRQKPLKKVNTNFSRKINKQEEIIDPLKEKGVVQISKPLKPANFLKPLPPVPSPAPISIPENLSPPPSSEGDEYVDETPPPLPEREEYREATPPPLPERDEYQDTPIFSEAYEDRPLPEIPREFLEEDSEPKHQKDHSPETTGNFNLLTNALASIRNSIYGDDDEENEEYGEEDLQEKSQQDSFSGFTRDSEIQKEKAPSSSERNNLLNEIISFDKHQLKRVNETDKKKGTIPLEKQLMNSMLDQFLQMTGLTNSGNQKTQNSDKKSD